MKFTALLEALSSKQIDYVNKKLGGGSYNPYDSHTDLFNAYASPSSPSRIVIPYNQESHLVPIDDKVKHHLASHGWGIHDYVNGMAFRDTIDRNGNPKREFKKIGKVLQDTGAGSIIHSTRSSLVRDSDGNHVIDKYTGRFKTETKPQSILEFYNNDPVRNSKSDINIVISRGKEDIAGMSSGRSWESSSCMRLPYSTSKEPKCQDTYDEHTHLKSDLKHHSLVAYAAKKGDDYLEKPMGRVTIKRYESTKKVNGKTHIIYRVGSDEYGNLPHGFVDQVNSIMEQHYPAHSGTEYKLAKGLYKENSQSEHITPVSIGLRTYENGYTHRNARGELHDYVDENGIHQPAYVNDNDIMYKKNGLSHREGDLPAEISKTDTGATFNAYKIHDQLHREGDKPAIETSDGSHMEWHLAGIPHRPNGKPQTIIKTPTMNKTIYVEHGLEHREGGLPSYERTDEYATEKRYKVRGKFQSPNSKTPSLHIKFKNGDEVKEFHLNDTLHSIDDQPAHISIKDGIVTKKWYKNGELGRDGGKPHTVVYNKKTKEIIERHWSRPSTSTSAISVIKNQDGSVEKFYHNNEKMKIYPNGTIQVSKQFGDNQSKTTTGTDGFTSIEHKLLNIHHFTVNNEHYIHSQYSSDTPKFFKVNHNGQLEKAFNPIYRSQYETFRKANSHLTDGEALKSFIDSHENGNLDHLKSSYKSMLTDLKELGDDTKVPISIRKHFKELHSNLNRG